MLTNNDKLSFGRDYPKQIQTLSKKLRRIRLKNCHQLFYLLTCYVFVIFIIRQFSGHCSIFIFDNKSTALQCREYISIDDGD